MLVSATGVAFRADQRMWLPFGLCLSCVVLLIDHTIVVVLSFLMGFGHMTQVAAD